MVFVTHSPQYTHRVGDRFLLLAGGRVAGDLTGEAVDADDPTRLITGGDELQRLSASLREGRPGS